MPVDKLLINQRLSYIKEYLEELVKLSELPKDKFLKKINSAAAESFLRRSLEAIFDVGRHILAKNDGTKFALEYKSIAKGLQEKGIINKDLENKLIQKAGYRNRLVHLYHQVSDEELFEIINNDLNDIHQFTVEILKYISKI